MKRNTLIILTLILSFQIYKFGYAEIQKKDDWREAEEKWRSFTEQYLKDDYEKYSKTPSFRKFGFHQEFKEAKSDLINKFFPDYRIFRYHHTGFPVHHTMHDRIFALNKNGAIITLREEWTSDSPLGGAVNPSYSMFIKSCNIEIADSEKAIKLIKLTKEIFYNLREDSYYKLKAHQKDGKWLISPVDSSQRFSQKPVQTMMQPFWEITLDEQKHVVEIKQKY